MITTEPTKEIIDEWKKIFALYKDKIFPNRISPDLIVDYLIQKYPVLKLENDYYNEIVIKNEKSIPLYAKKLKNGINPHIVVLELQNIGLGSEIYKKQDEVFNNCKIIIGIDISTGYFMVEGSSYIWDELLAYRGLNEEEINNYYLVAEYITSLKIFDRNNKILKKA